MTTITVTNFTDSPVAGEIDLRQAVAEASAGDVIVFPHNADNESPIITLNSPLTIAAGQDITIDGETGAQYGFGAAGALSDGGAEIQGQVIVEAGASVTLENGFVQLTHHSNAPPAAADGAGGVAGQDGTADGQSGQNGGGGGNGAAGANGDDVLGVIANYGTLDLIDEEVLGAAYATGGAAGGAGGDGADGGSGGPGGGGGKGGSGGPGGTGGAGGMAVGGVYNAGALVVQNSIIYGDAYGGDGGDGGAGGAGGNGGAGGDDPGGRGGDGGKGGNGGAIGVSGNGGSAYGAIYNLGTVDLIGVDSVSGTAKAGAGGTAGTAAIGGKGGTGGVPNGVDGADGVSGAVGANGTAGAAVAGIGGGGVAGQATTDAVLFFGGGPTNYTAGEGSIFSVEVDWYHPGGPATATVDWKVVLGPASPKLADFTTPTSGVLSFTNNYPGTIDQFINLTALPTASEPKYETFTVELYDPSAGNVIATATDTVSFVNSSATVVTVSGQPYASYQNIYNADDVLTGREFFNSDGSLYLAETIEDLANGEVVNAFSGGSFFDDLAYSGYDDVYSAGVLVGVDFVYSGGAGAAYSAYQYDYSAGGEFVGSKFFYGAAPGGSGYEFDYDGAGRLTRLAYSGVNAAYSAYEYDYVGGVLSGSKFTYTTVPSGAPYSSYEVDYNQAGALTGDKFFFTGSAGQGFTTEEEDFGANLGVTRVLLTGVQDQAYSSLEIDYDDGAYAGEKAYYLVKGEAYTHEEVDASASGQLEKVIYSGFSGAYSSVEQDFTNGALTDTVYSFTDVSGASYYAYQVTDSAGGAGLQETFDLASGAHTEIALAAGQTLTSLGNDKMTGSGATTFVLDAVYGADTITNFTSADTVSLSASEYGELASAIQSGAYSGGAAALTFSDGDTLTFRNTTLAALAQMSGDFVSHG